MQFSAFSDDDIQELTMGQFLLKEGWGEFKIKTAKEVRSKAGNPQMEIEMEVVDENGKKGVIYDYVFYSEAAKWKIVAFCNAIGTLEKLKTGMLLPSDIIGKTGNLMIIHEEWKGEKKNKVQRYLAVGKPVDDGFVKSENPAPKGTEIIDDEIPF
jgi:hypothetical protein